MSFKNLDLVNSDYIYLLNAGKVFHVEEKNSSGSGKCFFQSDKDILFIKACDSAPIIWSLKNRKCAEAAFVAKISDEEVHLHIVEMKSKLTIGEFQKVILQWRGMFLSALAALGVINEPFPTKVFVYVAFKKDAVNNIDPAQLVLLKTKVGAGLQPGLSEWKSNRVDLHHGVTAKIIKGLRTPDDYDFGVV